MKFLITIIIMLVVFISYIDSSKANDAMTCGIIDTCAPLGIKVTKFCDERNIANFEMTVMFYWCKKSAIKFLKCLRSKDRYVEECSI